MESVGAVERYRRWFEYERDSHARTLAALAAVPEELRAAEGYRRAVTLLAHVTQARRLWLHRLGAAAEGPTSVADFFPLGIELAEVAARLEATEAAWGEYLARLTEAELARVCEYRSLEGPRFRNTVEDILTQLFGHSWYHRGQIALLLRAAGAQPAATDFIYWAREALPDA
ncbi:MAG TPA: DinB family protein [Pyrinomonadaceae bacterium]